MQEAEERLEDITTRMDFPSADEDPVAADILERRYLENNRAVEAAAQAPPYDPDLPGLGTPERIEWHDIQRRRALRATRNRNGMASDSG